MLYRTGYSLLVSSAGTALLGVLFWVVSARSYDPEIVGHNGALLSTMQLVAAPAWVGQYAVLIRFLPTAGEHAQRLVITAYVTAAAVAATLGIIVALLGPEVVSTLDVLSSSPTWVLGFAGAVTAWSVFVLQDAAVTAIRAGHWVPVENISYGVAKLAVLAAVAGALPAYGIFAAWNFPLVVAIVGMNVLLFRRLLPVHRANAVPDPSLHDRRSVATYGLANWGATLLNLVPLSLIPVLVADELGARENAFFYIPWTISIVLPLIGTSMSTAMTVEGTFESTNLRELIHDSARHTAALLVPCVIVIVAAAPIILDAFGPGYSEHGTAALRLLAVAAIPTAVVQFAVGVARVLRETRAILVTQALATALSIGLTFLLLSSEGITGAAIAWLIAQAAAALVAAAWVLRPFFGRPTGARRGS